MAKDSGHYSHRMHEASQLFDVSVYSSTSRCTLMESMRFTTARLKPNLLSDQA